MSLFFFSTIGSKNMSASQPDYTSKICQIAQALIRKASITPEDIGCQQLMIDHLKPLGFEVEMHPCHEVLNFWAFTKHQGPRFVFAGHTDVVPTGDLTHWQHPPFEAMIEQDWLHGRGAADMKGSLACMLVAVEAFLKNHSQESIRGSIGFLITSDEEGPARHGTRHVIDVLQQQNTQIDYCVVGEPSASKQVGDIIKNGRRGSLGGKLTIKGKQGHIAYPHLAENPIHKALPALAALTQVQWDQGNDFFPPTSFQISNLNSGTGAMNVIPGEKVIDFNFRFSTEVTEDILKSRVHEILDQHQLEYELDWQLYGVPFLTDHGDLIDATKAAIREETGLNTLLSTAGGTSDGRFIAPLGIELVEIGPTNDTIHKVNERTSITELNTLTKIYYNLLTKLLL